MYRGQGDNELPAQIKKLPEKEKKNQQRQSPRSQAKKLFQGRECDLTLSNVIYRSSKI